MNNIVASLSSNVLKVTFWGKEGFGSTSSAIAGEVADDSLILDTAKFSELLEGLISQVVPPKFKPSEISFLVEPQDCILEFATVSKNGGDVDKQVLSVVSTKLEKGVVLENLYFSYQKIAPFVYQFIGVKKEILEKFLEIGNKLGLGLTSVVPWVLLLPKLAGNNQPSIFVSKRDAKQVVALAELNGIYFTGVYAEDKSQQELEELVQTLSVYKRPNPINRIYTVNCDSFTLEPEYDVLPLKVPGGDLEDSKGYEIHLLFNNVLEKQPQILETQTNLLKLLPVPVVEKKKVPMVVVGTALGVGVLVFLIGVFVLSRRGANGPSSSDLAMDVDSPPVVLSDGSEPEEATESVEEVAELKREDLKVRIENGSGVAGAAGEAGDFLGELGYNVLGIGDAEESDRPNTLVKFKSGSLAYKDLLVEDLMTKHTVVVEDGLDESLEYDVLIVIGLE